MSCGIGSPRLLPAGLIVLESIGFKSGQARRTPLVAMKLGPHVLVATVRGERSFWVKNLRKKPQVRFWRGGREHQARAFVLAPGKAFRRPASLPGYLQDAAQHPEAGPPWMTTYPSPDGELRNQGT